MDTRKEFTESDLDNLDNVDIGCYPYRTTNIRMFKESSEMIKKNGRYPVAAICFCQCYDSQRRHCGCNIEYSSMLITVDNYGNYVKGFGLHSQGCDGKLNESPVIGFADYSLDGECKFELSNLLINMIRNMKWSTLLNPESNVKIDSLDDTFIPLLNSFLGQIKILNEKMQNESSLP